jgi:hypothetical protein
MKTTKEFKHWLLYIEDEILTDLEDSSESIYEFLVLYKGEIINCIALGRKLINASIREVSIFDLMDKETKDIIEESLK